MKMTNHDMISFMNDAQATVEELRMFLEVDFLDEMKKKLDKYYMAMILYAIHPDFSHIRDQLLTSHKVPSMETLISRMIRVPTLQTPETLTIMEPSVMVATRGRGGRETRGGGRGGRGRPQCTYCKSMGHTQENCYTLHGFPAKTINVSQAETTDSKFTEDEYLEYLRLKSNSLAQSSQAPSTSTVCISQSMEGHNSWVIDFGASDHISGNTSLFSTISFQEKSHFITLANGSKTSSKGVGQAILSPSLNLKSVLFVPNCPFNLISLSQLTKTLNCSVTFDNKSFVIQERGSGRQIGEGYETDGLYHFGSRPWVSCVATPNPKILHDRLGHPHLSKLKKIFPELSSLQTLECESCQLGKLVRSTFPKRSQLKCISSFSVIHSNI